MGFAKYAKDAKGQPAKEYTGLDEAWAVLKETLEATTYDAVLGFSQGASLRIERTPRLRGTLNNLTLARDRKLSLPDSGIDHPPFKLAVLVSGFAMYDSKAEFFPANKGKSNADTLHVVGRSDVIVSVDRCLTLVDKFEDPRVEYHDGGHYVPSKGNWRSFFRNLFDSLSSESDAGQHWRDIQLSTAASGTSTPTSVGGGKL